jgi:poly-gamma-glutamate capsule biosynthesis protein CapA/YwtB (metallophosphatase superfamily)
LANNHIFDCSSEGVKETKRVLTENSILSVGAGQDLHEACEPLFIQAKDLGLAFVSYNFVIKDLVSADTHHGGAATLDACNHDYNSLKVEKGVDLIIASIHLGKWSANIKKEQVEIIQNLFDSGADIVIGHSPHIPQAIMATKDGRLAFFSLGNFIFDQNFDELTSKGLVLEVVVQGGEIIKFYPHEVKFNSAYQPYFSEPEAEI